MILQNQVHCKVCGDEPYSAHVHDYVPCSCGAVAVDGGMAYLKRTGEYNAMTEMSIEMPSETVLRLVDAIENPPEYQSSLGTVCALMRVLRDAGELK